MTEQQLELMAKEVEVDLSKYNNVQKEKLIANALYGRKNLLQEENDEAR